MNCMNFVVLELSFGVLEIREDEATDLLVVVSFGNKKNFKFSNY